MFFQKWKQQHLYSFCKWKVLTLVEQIISFWQKVHLFWFFKTFSRILSFKEQIDYIIVSIDYSEGIIKMTQRGQKLQIQ